MRLLLDTHVLLWVAAGSDRLSAQAQALIEDPNNQLYFNAASLWEISIKNKQGRADFKVELAILRRNLLDHGFEEVTISSQHTIAVDALPMIHQDPFDRMLIAQTMTEGVLLMTADSVIASYPVAVIKA